MKNYYVGVDVGATKIAAALISGSRIIKKITQQTEAKKSKTGVLKNIVFAIKAVYSPKTQGIGIGIAGQIDQKRGVVVSSPNFSKNFKNVELKKFIQANFKKPILVDNDANCFTLGEAIYGAGKHYKYVIGLTLGTGIGGGIVIDKKIYYGKNGLAGELGHTTIIQNGLVCSCGQKGHLEAYASGTAMVKFYQKLTGQVKDTFFIENQGKIGNKFALQVFKMTSESLATGLANIINVFNPEIIVLGGGLAKVKILTNPAVKLAKQKVIYPKLAQTKIITSQLREVAALLGAAVLFKKF